MLLLVRSIVGLRLRESEKVKQIILPCIANKFQWGNIKLLREPTKDLLRINRDAADTVPRESETRKRAEIPPLLRFAVAFIM
jgi:hypothetical protein